MDDTTITQTSAAFSLTCRVQANIRAKPETLWGLLTDAQGFPSWNSTVTASTARYARARRSRCTLPAPSARSRPRCPA